MRCTFRAPVRLLLLLLSLTSACDPGMTIRQTLSRERAASPGVSIQVGTSHPFIGESVYAPVVMVTNSSGSTITITAVELVFQGSLANKPRRAANFPLAVPPGQSDTLDVLFEVSGGVKKAFRVPAELRVYYTSSGKEETARATLVGEPLNADAP
jgi:hypothetical protein